MAGANIKVFFEILLHSPCAGAYLGVVVWRGPSFAIPLVHVPSFLNLLGDLGPPGYWRLVSKLTVAYGSNFEISQG